MRHSLFVARETPLARAGTVLASLVLIVGFANFTAVAAQVAVPLPFSPVPVSLQTLAVLLAGVCLGSRRGALSQLLYLAEGASGLPVFAGGKAGLAVLVGPTAGYLFGFVVAAFVVGWLCEHGWRRRASFPLLVALVLGNVVIYAFGAAWLGQFVPGGLIGALAAGVVPFLIGDAVKILIAAGVVPSALRLIAPRL